MSAVEGPLPASVIESVEPKCRGKRKAGKREGIPRQAFRRLVYEIVSDIKSDLRVQQDATDALQEAAEEVITRRFERCSPLVELCKKDTVKGEHWGFVADEVRGTLLG